MLILPIGVSFWCLIQLCDFSRLDTAEFSCLGRGVDVGVSLCWLVTFGRTSVY
jgi:energy-converting hydrogenase A subunit M